MTEVHRSHLAQLVTINAIANNRTKQVSLETLDKLCAALDVEPGAILAREAPRARAKRAR